MTKYELAQWYGKEMQRFGMSYYNERMNVTEPTEKLMSMTEFSLLSEKDKEKLLIYGNNMKMFGMGMYAERGACADYYNKCGGRPPRNPFEGEPANESNGYGM